MQTTCLESVKCRLQSSELAEFWGLVEAQTLSAETTSDGTAQKGDLSPGHKPLCRRNALGDIYLGIDAERVERFRLDCKVATGGGDASPDTPARRRDAPRQHSARRRRRVVSEYTTLTTIYEADDTTNRASDELHPDQSLCEVNNNNRNSMMTATMSKFKRRVGLGNIFEGIDDASVERLRLDFSQEAGDSKDSRLQIGTKLAQTTEQNPIPAMRRRKAMANIFEGLEGACIDRLQHKGVSSSDGTQEASQAGNQCTNESEHGHALWHVLGNLCAAAQSFRREHSTKTATVAEKLPTQQRHESKVATSTRKPVLLRRNASLNLLEGIDATTLHVLRQESGSSTDDSDTEPALSSYVAFSNSPRAKRRRNALTDVTELQKIVGLQQAACKATGVWLSGMFAC